MLIVKLYGKPADIAGRKHLLDVASPAEAVRALCVLYPALARWLRGPGKAAPLRVVGRLPCGRTIGYAQDSLSAPQSKGVLRIVPAIAGSGAVGQIIAGVALVAASFIPGLNVAVAAYMFSAGAALALGGAAAMIAAHFAPDPSQQNSPDNQPSYAFNGTVNTTGQGGPVPVGYGRLVIGSQIISVGFASDNEVWV